MNFSNAKQKAREIVSKMTVEEKASQLLYNSPAIERLGINEYNWWNEACHGVARAGIATVFPQAIGMAATFNSELVKQIGEVVSTEGRALYNKALEFGESGSYKGISFWAPNINIFRDPRWGRGQETYGEDPFLSAKLGCEYINGIQGNGEFLKAGACAKHFAVHSGPETIRFGFDSKVSEKDFRETYLPAFEFAVKSGVIGVMGAYNAINGEPSCANKKLILDILRKEWGFEGYFVSDCGAIAQIKDNHKYTETIEEASSVALKNGCNLNCGDAYSHLMSAYESDLITEEDITEAAVWVFTTRVLLGEFEETKPYSDIPYSVVDCPEHRNINLKAARESTVLLENKNNFLPLDPSKKPKIAVIGPNALSQVVLSGNYCGMASEYITVADGIRRLFSESDVRVSAGCQLYKDMPNNMVNKNLKYEAAKMAQNADITVLCVGYDSTIEGESLWDDATVDELLDRGDRRSLGLPKTQQDMVELVTQYSENIIVVVMGGGAIDIGDKLRNHAKAVIHAWYPGAQGGLAVAQLIAGEYSPCGKLPVTFYKDGEVLPEFTDYSMAGRTYRYIENKPLYPFGYGLTYTDTVCSDFKLTAENEQSYTVSVQIANNGNFDVTEKLQFYAQFTDSRTSTPNFQLCAIAAAELKKGESKTVQVDIDKYWLKAVDDNGNRIEPDGEIYLYAGTHQPDERSEELCTDKVLRIKVK